MKRVRHPIHPIARPLEQRHNQARCELQIIVVAGVSGLTLASGSVASAANPSIGSSSTEYPHTSAARSWGGRATLASDCGRPLGMAALGDGDVRSLPQRRPSGQPFHARQRTSHSRHRTVREYPSPAKKGSAMTSAALAAAMDYIGRGYSVIPFCKERKAPALAQGEIQTYRARAAHERRIRQWFVGDNLNIGGDHRRSLASDRARCRWR
jgi:hypothetical protein